MRPILTRSEITGAAYIATRYRILEDGSVDATEKYDVTDQFDAMTEPLRAENAKLRDFIELLLSCPRDSGECEECGRLNDLCAVELEAGKLGIEVNV